MQNPNLPNLVRTLPQESTLQATPGPSKMDRRSGTLQGLSP
jgi:hypothetical protein